MRHLHKILLRQDLAIKKAAYLIVRKKRGRLIGENKNALHKKKKLMFLQVFLNGIVINMTFWAKIISLAQN